MFGYYFPLFDSFLQIELIIFRKLPDLKKAGNTIFMGYLSGRKWEESQKVKKSKV